MSTLLDPFQILLVTVAGWVNQYQLQVIRERAVERNWKRYLQNLAWVVRNVLVTRRVTSTLRAVSRGANQDSQPFSGKNRRKTEAVPGLHSPAFPQDLRATAISRVIDYLREENRVLREQLGHKRLRLST